MVTITLSSNTSWYLYNFRKSTIHALHTRGYKVICLSPEDSYSQKLVSELGCAWLPLQMDNQGSNPIKDLLVFWQFFKIYRRYKPNVALHFTLKNNIYGTWAAYLLGIPAINNVSGLGTAFIHGGIVGAVVKLLYKISFPLAFRVFCQNEEDAALLVKNGLVSERKLRQLPGSGVDIHRFSPVRNRKESPPFKFLFVGRMLADKGLFELVEAVSSVNTDTTRCELLLCGFLDVENATAISTAQMDEWASAPYIHYLGSSDSVELEMAKVDCIVLPSYREGMPRSLLEAGAMGLPSVTTNVAGCRNIIEHNINGLLCEAKSTVSLQAALETMLLMAESQRKQMGQAARLKVVKEFSDDSVVRLTLDAVDAAIC